MSIFHEYWRMKAKKKLALKRKEEENRDTQYQNLNRRTVTNHSTIPNMTDAYRRVMSSGHKPSPEEIHFRRFTSGSYVDSE